MAILNVCVTVPSWEWNEKFCGLLNTDFHSRSVHLCNHSVSPVLFHWGTNQQLVTEAVLCMNVSSIENKRIYFRKKTDSRHNPVTYLWLSPKLLSDSTRLPFYSLWILRVCLRAQTSSILGRYLYCLAQSSFLYKLTLACVGRTACTMLLFYIWFLTWPPKCKKIWTMVPDTNRKFLQTQENPQDDEKSQKLKGRDFSSI